MVLDPLSSFAVACNVLHVVETGVKVLSKAAEYRKAEAGVLAEQKDLGGILQSLKNLNHDLQTSLLPQSASKEQSVEEIRLLQANDQCLRLSNQLIDLLDGLKLKERHMVFDSLRLSIKAIWHRDKMEAMEKSLSQARDNLNVAFLVYMNSKQATRAAQDDLLRNSARVEGSILKAVNSTTESLQDDIKSLEEQLKGISLDSAQQVVAEFTSSHHDLFQRLSEQLDSIIALHVEKQAPSDESQMTAAQQRVMDSLYFPQIRERKDHVAKAHRETYQWILEGDQNETQDWDNFISWLSANPDSNDRRIYWIRGKIGAGKTTLMRFLEENMEATDYMLPWAENTTVVQASCFFWSAGNTLQKSTNGLLRTLLTQLFDQTPALISRVVRPKKWQTALNGTHVLEWADSELQECLRKYIVFIHEATKVFLLIDGLDEFEGTDEAREELVDFLVDLANYENVKLCLSSRPWNIFREAFGRCPQLRLEDLTYNDIRIYVHAHLHGNGRFQRLVEQNQDAASALKARIIHKAAGVFLWVRLVIRDILRGLRDGDGFSELNEKIKEIPPDLDDYFSRLIESIEPQYREEASKFFQLALYEETEFASLHSNYLLDFSFIGEPDPDFALQKSYNFSKLDFFDRPALARRLESTALKVNSRCAGLLVCYGQEYEYFQMRHFDEDDNGTVDGWTYSILDGTPLDALDTMERFGIYPTAHLTVDLLHRSLRDFLLSPKSQELLHHHTQGPCDARRFFRNARLVQLVALNRARVDLFAAVGLASYLLSTLTVVGYRQTPSAAVAASVIQPVIENIVQFKMTAEISGWYLCAILKTWHQEKSTFLTLAIDFGLDSYTHLHLTAESVRTKEGRPILDHMLRPRFPGRRSDPCIGFHMPDTTLLATVLSYGASPNQIYRGLSLWALFLCSIRDRLRVGAEYYVCNGEPECAKALEILVAHGADILLSANWLSEAVPLNNDDLSWRGYPSVPVAIRGVTGNDTFCFVSDILERFRSRVGPMINNAKFLAVQRERDYLATRLYLESLNKL